MSPSTSLNFGAGFMSFPIKSMTKTFDLTANPTGEGMTL